MSQEIPGNIEFESIASSRVRRAFIRAYRAYKDLSTQNILVRRVPVSSTTMRAQPIINHQFWNKKKRHYRIDVSNHVRLEHYIPVQELPEDVLVGWFAHELGHIMDYQDRGVMAMIRFGLGYLFMPTYRMGAERRADIFAIEHGFAKYLVATKKYLLEHSTLPIRYKKRLEKFYMSPDEIAEIVAHQESEGTQPDNPIS